MAKHRELKKWNGRNGKRGSFYIAAYSQKQAAELLGKVSMNIRGTVTEIQNYFSPCWGDPMDGIEPTEPCVYENANSFSKDKPVKIYPKD